jgi:hypothetical protein
MGVLFVLQINYWLRQEIECKTHHLQVKQNGQVNHFDHLLHLSPGECQALDR